MDRTANDLLQQISNLTSHSVNPNTHAANPVGKPLDEAFIANLLQAAEQIDSDAVDSLVEEFGLEFSPEELLFAAQTLLSEENLSVDTENSKFAKDPYVAETDKPHAYTADPKSVEEILQTISGYEAEDATGQIPGPSSESEPSNITSVHDGLTNGLDAATPTIEQSEQQQETTSETFDENTHPDFNISSFADTTNIEELKPAPIRGAYEVDHELFDYQVVEEPELYAGIPQVRENPAAPNVNAPETPLAPSGLDSIEAETDSGDATEITTDDETAHDDNYFWANTGDVISIDGNQGFGHIDLACFDVSDATFRGNQIQIACDDGTSFLIEHCNVTFAIFADGVEIELTPEEPDSDQV